MGNSRNILSSPPRLLKLLSFFLFPMCIWEPSHMVTSAHDLCLHEPSACSVDSKLDLPVHKGPLCCVKRIVIPQLCQRRRSSSRNDCAVYVPSTHGQLSLSWPTAMTWNKGGLCSPPRPLAKELKFVIRTMPRVSPCETLLLLAMKAPRRRGGGNSHYPNPSANSALGNEEEGGGRASDGALTPAAAVFLMPKPVRPSSRQDQPGAPRANSSQYSTTRSSINGADQLKSAPLRNKSSGHNASKKIMNEAAAGISTDGKPLAALLEL
jgi:hypothetical protein